VPAGCAHGFIVVEGPVTLVYAQEGNYSQECDTGVRLTTVGVEMPVDGTVMSQRDRELPELSQFVSPFVFDVSDHIDWGSKT
jgi:dTDP-4-dehydrorhamnose 3,5-epimerase-like enzyme